jgi:histidyl-tRNA synthetase
MEQRRRVEAVIRQTAERFGFREVSTPTFESTELFVMKSGDAIVEELYAFEDKGGREISLRPELTAPVVRLYANNLQDAPKPVKFFYLGNCYRYERTQAGRYREFTQFGAEILGGDDVLINAEIIALATAILKNVGLGNHEVRIGYLDILRTLMEDMGIEIKKQGQYMTKVDKGDMDGLRQALDNAGKSGPDVDLLAEVASLRGDVKETVDSARKLLGNKKAALEALDTLEKILDLLEKYDIGDYSVDLGIARGLDYYAGMVFEVDVPTLGAEKQVCGGGSYSLTELFGLEAMPCTGFAIGFDRLVLALDGKGAATPEPGLLVYVVPFPESRKEALALATDLRKAGLAADIDVSARNLSKNLKYAAAINATHAIIMGTKELAKGKVTIRDMDSGKQTEVKLGKVVEHVKKLDKKY